MAFSPSSRTTTKISLRKSRGHTVFFASTLAVTNTSTGSTAGFCTSPIRRLRTFDTFPKSETASGGCESTVHPADARVRSPWPHIQRKSAWTKDYPSPFLVLPNTSSERREYVPIGWLTPDVIANQKLRILPEATLVDFALLTSAMHMAWMRAVTGRMKSDYMYSVGVVYNTFPMPPEGADLSKLGPLAQAVLDARVAHPNATLADLYDPDLMPPNLRQAHHALDRSVDRLYRRTGFASERDRVEHLFLLYEGMYKPLIAGTRKPRRRTRTTSRRAVS